MARDHHDLASQLSLLGLFAVSWKETQSVAPVGEKPSAPVQESAAPDNKLIAFFQTPKALVFLGCLAVPAIVWNLYYLNAKIPLYVRSDPNSMGTKLKEIQIGTERKDIEMFLKRQGAPQESSHTQYRLAPGILIEIDFDNTGGPWSPQNKVIHQPVTKTVKRPSNL